ncbi:hypothetical protein [Roseateles amylovorans]|uniref:Uncharacterized protein n=1 Tax=Roseateles amylovorans TaxID=2978473 RepID=A0ABY6B4J9_9BURK|nr:hypothetical protein [Roseateles amylovorans]UXH79207.1 hypothetical protein N4261_04530 [Roseateles amylovorans]
MRYGHNEGLGVQPPHHQHQFSLVMQRILRQTDLLLQRRQAPATEPEAAPPLDGLEVHESTWDEWAEVMSHQLDGR